MNLQRHLKSSTTDCAAGTICEWQCLFCKLSFLGLWCSCSFIHFYPWGISLLAFSSFLSCCFSGIASLGGLGVSLLLCGLLGCTDLIFSSLPCLVSMAEQLSLISFIPLTPGGLGFRLLASFCRLTSPFYLGLCWVLLKPVPLWGLTTSCFFSPFMVGC